MRGEGGQSLRDCGTDSVSRVGFKFYCKLSSVGERDPRKEDSGKGHDDGVIDLCPS